MEDEIAKLVEAVSSPASPIDLEQRFRCATVKAGLEKFYLILKFGLELTGDGKLRFQSWERSQVQAVVSVASAIASASRCISADQVEATVVSVLQQLLEFALSYLEKSEYSGDDLSIQNDIVRLLEIGLVNSSNKDTDFVGVSAGNALVDLLPTSSVCSHKIELHVGRDAEGGNYPGEAEPLDKLLTTLTLESLQYGSVGSAPSSYRDLGNTVSLLQHCIIIRFGGIQRLLLICKEIVEFQTVLDEKSVCVNFFKRLTLSLRILKLLRELVEDIPCANHDMPLLQAVSLCAEALPSLFTYETEFLYAPVAADSSYENVGLLVLEEFLHNVRTIFCNSFVFQNIQAFIVASMLDNLGSSVWRYNMSDTTLKAPLVYFPRVVMYMLKLIENVKRQKYQALDWTDLELEHARSHDNQTIFLSRTFHSEKVAFLKKYTSQELMQIMFSPSVSWVDNLMHLASFLHSEAAKLRLKLDRSHSCCAKPGCISEQETTETHEDEALFGDLFSEGGRSVGSTDGRDQPSAASSFSSSVLNQAALEVLTFMKTSIFTPEWHISIYKDGCEQFSCNHVDVLLSVIKCQSCFSDDRVIDRSEFSNGHLKVGNTHEVCFELLHDVLARHALSQSLEEYLIERILYVDNGMFVYNNLTLTLLAHTLISKAGASGSQLRTKIYREYIDFIIGKVKSICTQCPSLTELLLTLPSAFHIEIILVAFHLSSESEKTMLANLIFSTFRTIDALGKDCSNTQLSCWALVVSRLILVFRHMICYPSACPSLLLRDLQARIREAPHSSGSNDNFYFWAPTVVESALGLWMKEDPKIINLLSQLLDFSGFPISFSKYDSSIERLCLSRNDIRSFFSRTLGYWNAKKATMVEDLIIERYIFALCWDIPSIAHKFSFWRGPWTVEISDMENIFLHSLLNFFSDASLNTNSPQILDRLLRILSSVHIPDNMEELGWHFMRSGIWLSLVLSLFHAGIMGYSIKNAVPGVGSVWMEKTSWDTEYLTFAENLVTSFFRDGQVAMLFRTLSFLLDRYLQVYQKAFLSTMSENEHCTVRNVGVLHLLLLTHTECEKYVQDELLEKSCCSHSHLESICNLLPELNAIVDKKSSGIVTKIYHECILHGFPCYNRTSSATLVSCILVIKQIVSVLEILVKVQDAIELCSPEIQVLCQFLDSVMTIKSDRIFWCLHEKCESVYGSLTSGVDGAGYRNLFLLKQMEEFLRDSNSREAGGGQISEWIVTKAIDTMDSLRKNPSKVIIFKFYLCAEDVSEHVNGLYGLQRCDLVILIDLLDSCFSESVNVKVLNFFVDLISGEISPPLIQKIQQKFCDMNFSSLLKWLERRLLGYSTETVDGIACAEGSSTSLKESTMDFIACITSRGSQCHLKILHNHLFEGMLLLLDTAFISYDIHTAKSYFQFVVQLSKEEALMRALLERTLLLMEKLSRNERLLQGLKFLFGFLVSVLSDSVSIRSTTKRPSGKSLSSSGFGVGSMAFRMLHLGKSAEDLLVSANQKEGATSLECDAISADEDEDDATSDGEVASLDKNEEEDAKGESALASKVCTFTSSGSNFMEQHWYFCYTCDLTLSKGCCSVCAKVCHRGHRVVYSRSSRFFCDCGAGGVRGTSCQCLKPRKLNESSSAPLRNASNVQSLLSITEDGSQSPNSDSDIDDDVADKSLDFSVPSEIQDKFPLLLKEVDIEGQVLGLCSSLIPFIISRRDSNLLKDKEVALGQDKVISYSADLLQLKKAYKSGSLDMKMKADYTNSKELKSLLAGGSLVKSLLSVSNRGRLAVGEGDKVTIFDIGQLIGQATIGPVTADKANVKPLSKNVVRFEIVHIVFNPIVESYLSVAGYEDCQVLTVSSRGEVTDRLGIELALQGAYIRRIDWVPGSQVQLMVVTNRFIKVYDLSQDNISPLHYFTLPDEMIVDATLLLASRWRMFLVVLSESGSLFRLELSVEGNVGAKPLKDVLQIRDRDIHGKGLSLYFSTTYKLLFLSYQDGSTLVGRLNSDATSFCGISAVYENEQDGKLRPAGLHHWRELLIGSGLFFCFSNAKSNAAISVGLHELFAQNLRHAASSASLLVGVTAYKPLSEDKFHCLALHDDGSLQIYIYVPSGVDGGSATVSDKVKKLGPNILNNKAYAVTNPEFPLDFFEKTICITADVKLGGDAVQNGDSEGAKQNLASEEGYLESPGPAGFKISVSNPNPDIVMVGFRIHVGNTSPNHIPSDISIFQRVIKLDEGIRSWYDIPFTVAESLLADEEFTISVGPPCNSTLLSRIDSLEVYGRAKDEFGWKEKLNAVLDMEARALGLSSCDAGSGKKYCSLQATTIQEQVIADGLKLLSVFYSLCGSLDYYKLEVVKSELSKLKCKQLLEMIFESEREPLLQAAACRVLHAICPRREIYHQIKDTMRLLGVVKSTSIISSRFGFGGAMGGWVIEEFTAQMRVVSKIALLRRANLATFLEMHGSQVVDGLMHVLWGLLDIEQPDIHTTKNIVISSVELMYCYAECLALHGKNVGEHSVAPAVELLKKLLFSSNEAVQTSASLAISSKLLQVPFPKQTMLASDDVMESDRPVNVSGGNTQVMIEEDSITSSVQYCCDGCSTVPILRRRWHCTVCPDFDLCETCYELLHADGLPPPHSKDHPMSAISIEMEPLGGSGNDVHFISEDMTSSSSVCSRSDGGVANATPVHVLESNKNGDFSAPIFDPVSISASKRAVNSLLLSELLEQLSGWMDKTSGVGAIPVMQLFYRLSSATSGPFMDSSRHEGLGLEKLIKWFLDEINLRKPFGAHVRSSFGEVAILVFMFFTLMLRNWHQPGTDSSISKSCGTTGTPDKSVHISSSISGVAPSSFDVQEKHDFESQLIQACNSLRQQAFINYLMDILQQLVHVFKSHIVRSETAQASGCGALLTVRRELPAGNFSPFFSDSYTKSHRSDIFMDYHRLLLETVFRLAYSLVRPEKQDKSGEKEKTYRTSLGKDLKLDGYQDVLCSYINNPNTAFVRRYARRLFLHLCGSKTQYYNVRDNWQFSTEAKKFYKHVNKSGGFMSPASYERSVKIMRCLSTMVEVASARPRNWQKFCLRHRDVFLFMMNLVFYLGEESIIQTLKLLNLAFYTGKDLVHSSQKAETGDGGTSSNKSSSQNVGLKKKKKGGDENDSSLEMAYLDMESILDIFMDNDHEVLRHFIDFFLLEWSSSSVRVEAKCVLYGVWHHGKQAFKEIMMTVLLQKVKCLPVYGQNIIEYTELVSLLLGSILDISSTQQRTEIMDKCLTPDVINCIYDTIHSQNEFLANHPNSRIYNILNSLVEFDGYYLESEPCVACSSPEVPYSRMKLENLKSETKFTDNRIIVKCTGSYTIESVTMTVHDARKPKSVKVLNLYYNNRPVADLSELKNSWSMWKRAKNCHLALNQTELKVVFPIAITACNIMIELDSFYENLQALSLEPLQCPRCSRPVTDKHGICSNCHENAYQCRQCRNINYENLDSFLCNECGYSKYGRFEFNFMAKPSFAFDDMESDDDMRKGLAAIESESESAHRRYQQLLGFKKPLLKIVSSIGENEMDSQQKDSVQQMMVSLPGPSCKVNRKIALLGVLYGEKCKAAFDSVSRSIQTLQGLRRVLMNYLHKKNSDNVVSSSRILVSKEPTNCYGCAATLVTQCLEILQVLAKHQNSKKQLVAAGILSELFENNIHQGLRAGRVQARFVLCAFSEGDITAVTELNSLIQKKVMYCLEHHRSMDIALATREELLLLSELCTLADEYWESRLRIVFQLLFSSIKIGAKHPAICEHVILPCLRIISHACTPPKPDAVDKDQGLGNFPSATSYIKDDNNLNQSGALSSLVTGSKSAAESTEKSSDGFQKTGDIQLISYSEWENGASYLDFVRRHYKVSQVLKGASQGIQSQRFDYLALKYALRWRSRGGKKRKSKLFELGSWVTELVLSACSQSTRSEICMLITLLCARSSSRRCRLLNLLMTLLPATLSAGESATEYFELLFKMIDSEDARLFLTLQGCLATVCKLVAQEVGNIEALERSLDLNISQGFVLHKLIELLGKFLEVPNIRSRFMRDNLLPEVLEALIVIRGLIVQKTKLISDCNRLLRDLLDSLLLESSENKRQFIRACISGLQIYGEERKGRACLFILEQLCNLICPSKPEPVYLLVLNKVHTQEEFIRGSMTKNPYSSSEIGPLMRDVKNKICNQLDLLGLLEDDYGMELLVAGNIISLDLSIAQVYEQVWKKSNQCSNVMTNSAMLPSNGATSSRDCPPMTVTYRLQGLDGEATEPMIKELEEDREETQDPEVEFAIAGAVREYGGLDIILTMIQRLHDDFKSNHEQLVAVLNLLMLCCKIRENRRALLRLGALGLLLETARRAFSVDAIEPAEGILLIVESLTLEANESDDISIAQSVLTVASEETGAREQAKKIVLMFLERLCHPSGFKKSNKQQRNTEMVARILPYLTYGEPAAMEALIQHFYPYLQDWSEFDRLQEQHQENPKDENISLQAAKQRFALENFVRVSESLKTSFCGERLKDIILDKAITSTAVRYLRESFGMVGKVGFKSGAKWASGLKLPSVPLILSMLKGLSVGHAATQRCIDEGGILPLLHALEGVAGENDIGARAENLLDTLCDGEGKGDGLMGEKVRMLRRATRHEMRRRALRKREELLQGLGMRQELASDGGERIVVAQPVLEGLEDVQEEEGGLACMVCREGYSLRPVDLLGVYTYSKRVNLGVGTSGSLRGECVYTTVSHFNIIHFQCHQEAKRADSALKNPKKEWEGATLRNNETLCNSLFPISGPAVPVAQYVRYVDQYWDNLNALGRADGNRLRLLIYDIVLMLARFATGASFSTDSKGGGRESNSRFLTFMIQMARHLLDHGGSSQRGAMAKAVSTYLTPCTPDSKPSTSWTHPSTGTEETVQFMMVNSLLSESYESWLQHRSRFLQRGIYHAYMQHTHGRSTLRASPVMSESASAGAETGDMLAVVQPMLVYTGLIQKMQHFFKVKKNGSAREGTAAAAKTEEEEGEGEESAGLEGWEVVMKGRVTDVGEMVGFSKELLSWLEDMNSASHLQEAFDIVGALPDVLSGGFARCEDFVRAAISMAKS